MKRTRLRRIGKRGRADRAALDEVREAVLERAGWKCERCGSESGLHLHHLLSRARGGAHQVPNLAVLCSLPNGGCHHKVHTHLVDDWQRWLL